MTRLARVLLVLLIIGFGFIIYLIISANRGRTDLLPAEVSADSIKVYQQRADSLEMEVPLLRARLEDAGLLQQPRIRQKLTRLEEEIASLKNAVERWRASRDTGGDNQSYRQCVLLYGRATGICDVLQVDTTGE